MHWLCHNTVSILKLKKEFSDPDKIRRTKLVRRTNNVKVRKNYFYEHYCLKIFGNDFLFQLLGYNQYMIF